MDGNGGSGVAGDADLLAFADAAIGRDDALGVMGLFRGRAKVANRQGEDREPGADEEGEHDARTDHQPAEPGPHGASLP